MDKNVVNFPSLIPGQEILNPVYHQPINPVIQMEQDAPPTKKQVNTDACNPLIELPPEETGVDNRLRAVFGKLVPQLAGQYPADPPGCYAYLRKASAADDANDRAAYLQNISDIWDQTQNYRELCREDTKPKITNTNGKTKSVSKKKSKDATAIGGEASASSSFYDFDERDLLWIVKYAEFGKLVAQASKTSDVETCFCYLRGARLYDKLKNKFEYELAMAVIRKYNNIS